MEYRSRARIVAIADLILTSMSLCLIMVMALGAFMISEHADSLDSLENDGGSVFKSEDAKDLASTLYIIVAIAFIANVLQLVAAVKLINATQLGKEPKAALQLAKFWRSVCIVFTILTVFVLFTTSPERRFPMATLCQFVLRLLAICIVTKFMRELEVEAATGALPYTIPSTTVITAYAFVPPKQGASINAEYEASPPCYSDVVKECPPPKQ